MDIPETYRNKRALIKLDSNGKLLWEIYGAGKYIPNRLKVDQDNNLVALGHIDRANLELYRNGIASDTLATLNYLPQINQIMVKFSPEGEVLWEVGLYFQETNGAGSVDFGIDGDNNIYLTGHYEHRVDFYSAGSAIPQSITSTGNSTYGSKTFVSKVDPDGQLIWKVRSYTQSGSNSDRTRPFAIAVDDAGYSYLTGTNDVSDSTTVHRLESTDGTTTEAHLGGFYLAKLNPSGVWEWIQGGRYARSGGGHDILLKDDQVYTIGTPGWGPDDISTFTFSTAAGDEIELTISEYDYFMAVYDTTGVLQRVVQNGENYLGQAVQLLGFAGFFAGEDGSFYLSANVSYFLNNSNYSNFGQIIEPTDGVDGIITRFVEDCGIIYPSQPVSTTDAVENFNQYTVFPNPASEQVSITFGGIKAKVAITVYDARGRRVSSTVVEDQASYEFSLVGPVGLYLISITENDKVYTRRLLKQ